MGRPCYKPSTLRHPIREVPVRRKRSCLPADQMSLFCARVTTPKWTELPPDVRAQALPLLARLLRLHRQRLIAGRIGREACDE